jgi:hypothetical protein
VLEQLKKAQARKPINHMQKIIPPVVLFSFLMFCNHLVVCQISGCPDPLAVNYNVNATINDGSCQYNHAVVSPESSVSLPAQMMETSGLIIWNNRLVTHNDDTDIHLYAFNPDNVNDVIQYQMTGTQNKDWEEISQDDTHIYIGDFGNNANGNRTDLHILKICKQSILLHSPDIDTIAFVYENQFDFSQAGANNTDFDCEAFVIINDSIYLFTKQWNNFETTVYVLPKTPGSYVAKMKQTYYVDGLITGACKHPSQKLIVLTGYNITIQPFVFLLYDYHNEDFFSGNKRKIELDLPFHQIEAIASADFLTFYLTNEKFVLQPHIDVPQTLHFVQLSSYLSDYLGLTDVDENKIQEHHRLALYPNPCNKIMFLEVSDDLIGSDYVIYDMNASVLQKGVVDENLLPISTDAFQSGIYQIQLISQNSRQLRKRFVKY